MSLSRGLTVFQKRNPLHAKSETYFLAKTRKKDSLLKLESPQRIDLYVLIITNINNVDASRASVAEGGRGERDVSGRIKPNSVDSLLEINYCDILVCKCDR